MINNFLRLLEDVFFPAKCLNCYGKVKQQELFCSRCRHQLVDIRFLYPQGYDCKDIDGICIFFSYELGVKKALHKIKFSGKKNLLPRVAKEFQQVCCLKDLQELWDLPKDLFLVPVPTDKTRQQERGYDLPTGIFKSWGEKEHIIWYEALVRVKTTMPQYGLTRTQRRKNVKKCFVVKLEVVNKDIILVDDIFTSGATMEEAARTLKKAGAKRVWSVSFAGGAQI